MNIITESDILSLFQPDPKIDFGLKKTLILFGLLFGLLFSALNYRAIWSKWQMIWLKDSPPPERVLASEMSKTSYSETSFSPTTANFAVGEQPTVVLETDVMQNNQLYIPSVNILVPVIWDTPTTDTMIRTNLANGVVHLMGTAHPGEVGNVFITGHSSDLPWTKGNYKSAFANLTKLKIGQNIYLLRGGQLFTYQTENIFQVKPDQVEVMEQGDQSILTLSTCVPVGTNSSRLIVVAKQISPDPEKNQPFAGPVINLSSTIPSGQ